MSRTWFDPGEALPPDGADVLAQFADGRTFPARLRIGEDAVIWEVEGDVEVPPTAWAFLGSKTGGIFKAELGRLWWAVVWALAAALLVALASPAGGLIILTAGVGLVLYYAVANSLGQMLALDGGRHGLILGAVVAVVLGALPLIVIFVSFARISRGGS